ncbi:hypothetical protein EB73_27970 [Mycobacterium sp. SWH-M3]|nr:hypothetical protein EB73_27970 [Mycobacterium sp. SWH-M3]
MSTHGEGERVAGGKRRGRCLGGGALAVVIVLAATVLVGIRMERPDTVAAPEEASTLCPQSSGPADYGVVIISSGLQMGIPPRGIVAGLSAAQRETGMRNVANPRVPESLTVKHDGLAVDGQAVGLFLQGPQWGSVADRMTPSVAAELFFGELQKIAGWQEMPEAVAAQKVQRTAFAGSYADDAPAAWAFYRQHVRAADVICG